jgi:SAM-dependent methyltransferase
MEPILRNDVYRRPLITALERLKISEGWICADVGAGGGDVSISLASLVGSSGRIYAVDSDPKARDITAKAAAAQNAAQVIAVTQSGEELMLPEQVDLCYCRFLLMHVREPKVVIAKMADNTKTNGWLLIQEPVTSAGRIGGIGFKSEIGLHPDIGAVIPKVCLELGLELSDCWAEAPAGCQNELISKYLESLTGVNPGNDPVVLPPLVTTIARKT